jgi:hypothetical protein
MSLSRWVGGGNMYRMTGLNGMTGWLATVKSLSCKGPSYHAMGVRGRLRFDRSLPKRDYESLWRKGSQVKQ